MSSEHDWIDDMLRDALLPKSRDFDEFEAEYDAIKQGMRDRKGRAIICAAASLAAATSSLRIASHLPLLPSDEDSETMKQTILFLCRVLTREQITYLPAILAATLLREDEP